VEGVVLSLLAFMAFGLVLWGLHDLISKLWPVTNLELIAVGAGILILSTYVQLCFSLSPLTQFIIYSLNNIFVGWLLTWPFLVRGAQKILGVLLTGSGSQEIWQARQIHYEIKGKKAMHGLFSSLIASLTWLVISIMVPIPGFEQDQWPPFLKFSVGCLFIVYSSALGRLGSAIGRGSRQ
jgi:hypothetical protein